MDKFDIKKLQHEGFIIIDSPYDKDDIIKLTKALNAFVGTHLCRYNSYNDNFEMVYSNILKFLQKYPDTIVEIEHLLSNTPEFFRILSNPIIKNTIGQILQIDADEPLNFNGSVIIVFRNNSLHYTPELIKTDKQVSILAPIIVFNNGSSHVKILNNKANSSERDIDISLNPQELLVLNSSVDYKHMNLLDNSFNIFIQGIYYGASANIIEVTHAKLH